jgi:hypothetical protein
LVIDIFADDRRFGDDPAVMYKRRNQRSRGTEPAAPTALRRAALPSRSIVCRMRVQTFAISLCPSRHDPQHHAH